MFKLMSTLLKTRLSNWAASETRRVYTPPGL